MNDDFLNIHLLDIAYLDSVIDLFSRKALRKGEPLTLELIYNRASLKRKRIKQLFKDHPDFHLEVICKLNEVNER